MRQLTNVISQLDEGMTMEDTSMTLPSFCRLANLMGTGGMLATLMGKEQRPQKEREMGVNDITTE